MKIREKQVIIETVEICPRYNTVGEIVNAALCVEKQGIPVRNP